MDNGFLVLLILALIAAYPYTKWFLAWRATRRRLREGAARLDALDALKEAQKKERNP